MNVFWAFSSYAIPTPLRAAGTLELHGAPVHFGAHVWVMPSHSQVSLIVCVQTGFVQPPKTTARWRWRSYARPSYARGPGALAMHAAEVHTAAQVAPSHS